MSEEIKEALNDVANYMPVTAGILKEKFDSLKIENTQLKASALNKRVEELKSEADALRAEVARLREAMGRALSLMADNEDSFSESELETFRYCDKALTASSAESNKNGGEG